AGSRNRPSGGPALVPRTALAVIRGARPESPVRSPPGCSSEPGVVPDGTRPRPYEPTGAAGRRSWTQAWILDQRPHLRPVFTSVAGTLVRHGLAEQTDWAREAMEQLGKDFREQLG